MTVKNDGQILVKTAIVLQCTHINVRGLSVFTVTRYVSRTYVVVISNVTNTETLSFLSFKKLICKIKSKKD